MFFGKDQGFEFKDGDHVWVERTLHAALGSYPEESKVLEEGRILTLGEIDPLDRDRIMRQAMELNNESLVLPYEIDEFMKFFEQDESLGLSRIYLDANGRVKGFVFMYQNESKAARLSKIVVASDQRGTGIGKKLILSSALAVSQMGIPDIDLRVRKENVLAKKLYSTLGFEDKGEIQYKEAPEIEGYHMSISTQALLENLKKQSRSESRAELSPNEMRLAQALRNHLSSEENFQAALSNANLKNASR